MLLLTRIDSFGHEIISFEIYLCSILNQIYFPSRQNFFTMTEIDRALVAEVVVDSLKYTNSINAYIPVFLKEKDKNNMIKAISLDMRRRLPEATRYATFLIICRLSEFSSEAAEAFQEERTQKLPKPKTHTDYTVWKMWQEFNTLTEDEYNKTNGFQPLNWNPFIDLTQSLHALAVHVGDKHFGINIDDDEEEDNIDEEDDFDRDQMRQAMELLEYETDSEGEYEEETDHDRRRRRRREHSGHKRPHSSSSEKTTRSHHRKRH